MTYKVVKTINDQISPIKIIHGALLYNHIFNRYW